MKIFNDRMILDRKDFELAMEQELASVNNGLISMYIAKQYKRILIDNIHKKALKLNILYEELNELDINNLYPARILELSRCLGVLETAKYITKRSRAGLVLYSNELAASSSYGIMFEDVDLDAIHCFNKGDTK